MTDPTFHDLITVQRYTAQLADLEPKDRDTRLGTLAEFAEFVGRTPDQMIAEIFNEETRKYRKRGFYSDRVKEFSAALDGPRNRQLFRGNVIRSFFIANGRRIPPEQPDWI
ncbi:hypothetical protein [Streptomyces pinistramenti]|uniref:hypothetical protein n=1 Tax=Streptomyces pinistramenti TaxID=2884812 RepID=UPI001D08D65E|nr:hypothetical protein [Streptomyces pinistramenti]MCB5912114.1 hypothetical protein [Streptomyces pinistramenti]